jgi:hypothetical protein
MENYLLMELQQSYFMFKKIHPKIKLNNLLNETPSPFEGSLGRVNPCGYYILILTVWL